MWPSLCLQVRVNQEQIYVRRVSRTLICFYGFRSEDEKKLFLHRNFGFWDWSISSRHYLQMILWLGSSHWNQNITCDQVPKIGRKPWWTWRAKVVVAGDTLLAVQALKTRIGSYGNLLALGYKETELKKIKKFFEGTAETAENIKSALRCWSRRSSKVFVGQMTNRSIVYHDEGVTHPWWPRNCLICCVKPIRQACLETVLNKQLSKHFMAITFQAVAEMTDAGGSLAR